MKRLTTYRADGRAAIANNENATPKQKVLKIPKVIDRLAAYEDTGLEPEEVRSQKELFDYLVFNSTPSEDIERFERLSELAKADVAEVRHGRWIPKINHTYIPVEYDENGIPVLHEYISYRCSLCGREETKEEPYCHCGARMDKEDDKQ